MDCARGVKKKKRKRKMGVLDGTDYAHRKSMSTWYLEEAVISILPIKCSNSRLAFKR